MPQFPTRQADIVAMTMTMGTGYITHPADFPSINPYELGDAYVYFLDARDAQVAA